MPAVPSWAPAQFDLTNPYNGTLSFNVQTGSGIYLLDRANCSFDITTRATVDNVPQSDGSILHYRFVTGAEIRLSVILMQDPENIACDDLLADMLDDLTGAFRSLLNAGDNQGRLAWEVAGKPVRMLDDVRLLVYPVFDATGTLPTVNATIDSQYPFAQDLEQQLTTITDGNTDFLMNDGTATYFPVFKVYGPVGAGDVVTVSNVTTGQSLRYSGTGILTGHYIEIDTFRNTVFLDGDGADRLSSIDIINTVFPTLATGSNEMTIDGADMDILWAPAWG